MLDTLDTGSLIGLLSEGTLILVKERPGGGVESVLSGVQINAPADRVFDTIQDFESFPSFMPQTDMVRILSHDGNEYNLEFKVSLKFGIISTKFSYVLKHIVDRSNMSIRFDYVKGEPKDVHGMWKVVRLSEDSSAVFYEFHSNLRSLGFMMKKVLSAEPSLETAIQTSTAYMITKALKKKMELA